MNVVPLRQSKDSFGFLRSVAVLLHVKSIWRRRFWILRVFCFLFFGDVLVGSSALVTELRQSLQTANDSATGLDQVHYQLLTHLPNSALSVLSKVYNHVWESGCFPPSWREAAVIPIPKPGKIT